MDTVTYIDISGCVQFDDMSLPGGFHNVSHGLSCISRLVCGESSFSRLVEQLKTLNCKRAGMNMLTNFSVASMGMNIFFTPLKEKHQHYFSSLLRNATLDFRNGICVQI